MQKLPSVLPSVVAMTLLATLGCSNFSGTLEGELDGREVTLVDGAYGFASGTGDFEFDHYLLVATDYPGACGSLTERFRGVYAAERQFLRDVRGETDSAFARYDQALEEADEAALPLNSFWFGSVLIVGRDHALEPGAIEYGESGACFVEEYDYDDAKPQTPCFEDRRHAIEIEEPVEQRLAITSEPVMTSIHEEFSLEGPRREEELEVELDVPECPSLSRVLQEHIDWKAAWAEGTDLGE